jgi:hypothetical protein
MPLLTRYWFEFELGDNDLLQFGYFPSYVIGITAYDYEDAFGLLRRWVLQTTETPKIRGLIENVDVSRLLEQKFEHTKLLPHLGCPAWRGVWHPAYNLWYGPDIE